MRLSYTNNNNYYYNITRRRYIIILREEIFSSHVDDAEIKWANTGRDDMRYLSIPIYT